MREQYAVALRQSVPVLAVAAALGMLGSAALPLVFSDQPGLGGLWLGIAIVMAVGVLVLMPALTRPLAASLSSLTALVISPNTPGQMIPPSQTLNLARLLVVIADVLITQAMLRKPIAVVLGGERQSALVESAIAAAALTILLALLTWTYQAARPLVQAGVLRAIDAAIPTTGSIAHVESPTTRSQPAVPPTARAPVDEAQTVAVGETTTTAAQIGAAATFVSPRRIAHETQASGETLVAGDTSDETVVGPPANERTAVAPRHTDETLPGNR